MRIHSYRRTEPYTIDLAPRGLTEQLVRFYLLENTKAIVADVEDEHHQELLLRVPEAYREYEESNTSTALPVDPAAEAQRKADEARRTAELRDATQRQQIKDAEEKAAREARQNGTLIGSSVQPSIVSLTGNKTVPLGEVVAAAHRASGLSVEEWNELQGDEREALISSMVTTMEREAEEEEAAEMERIRKAAELEEQQSKEKAAAEAEAKAKAEADAKAAAEAAKFTLLGPTGESIDLKTYDDAALRDFAKTYSVPVPSKLKGDALRQLIVDTLAPTDQEKKAAEQLNQQQATEASKE